MAEDLTLKLYILARGQEALKVLGQVEHGIRGLPGHVANVGRLTGKVFSGLAGTLGFLLKPLAAAGKLAGGLSLAFGGLSYAAVNAAGEMEALKLRLAAVSGSAEASQRVFTAIQKLAIASPFEMGELISAQIGLLNLGLTGERAITALGDAAAVTERPLEDLVAMLGALSSESLRRMGVGMKTKGEEFTFTFRDRMQQVQSITAKGVDDARAKLLSIFDVKYGGGMQKFASAWKGLTSTLTDAIKIGLSYFGEGLMPAAKRFIGQITTKLTEFIETGKLQEWGAKVGNALERAFDVGRAVVDRAQEMVGALKDQGPEAARQAFLTVFTGAGELLARSLANYLGMMGNIFAGLGRMIAAGFLEHALSVELPGMGKVAARTAAGRWGELGAEDKAALTKETGFELSVMDDMSTKERAKALGNLPQSVSARIAGAGAGSRFAAGVEQFAGAVPQAAEKTLADAKEIWTRTENALAGLLGTGGKTVMARADEYTAEREEGAQGGPMGPERYNVAVHTRKAGRLGRGIMEMRGRSFQAPVGQYRMGQDLGGGEVVVNIQNMVVRANDIKQFQNSVKEQAVLPRMAAAGVM